jgi:hypothetical protein
MLTHAAILSIFDTTGISATLTTDVPEPSTWAMMILGFAGVALVAYRRKRNGSALAAADFLDSQNSKPPPNRGVPEFSLKVAPDTPAMSNLGN